MSELLSPAGTIEAFHAAISNGADAIYLGLDKFSARAYANNFTLESLKPLLDFAHLRNVKIFVTINTIIFDEELDEVFKTIDSLAQMGVDAVITQDLAVAHYIIGHYPNLHAHASTQMGVDDIDASKLLKDFGFKRIVFARETPIETIKDIKNKLNIEVEAFIHGALCVSYSGNCYMSSAIGERSGNRGRCAGCCRKYYKLVNFNTNFNLKEGYLLSMKDLNVSSKLDDMRFVDSLKIEGRMKEPNYVASVTNIYRKLLDKQETNIEDLNKVFNRTYTSGYMFGSDSSTITNIDKPNNYGYPIGTVIKQNKTTVWVRIAEILKKGDQIRIDCKDNRKEISVPILKLFDANFKEVQSISNVAIFTCKDKVEIGAKVYITKNNEFVKKANESLLHSEYYKLPLNMNFIAKNGKPIILNIKYKNYEVYVKSDSLVEPAKTQPTNKDNIYNQLSKLNNTPYLLHSLNIDLDDNCFIPLKTINELRRKAIEELNNKRLDFKFIKTNPMEIHPQKYSLEKPILTVEVSNIEQYNIVKNLKVENIYFDNIVRRNNANYKQVEGDVLVNGYGGINHYLNTNPVIVDSSLNVTNYITVGILSQLGVKRITLSQEISKTNIQNLIDKYKLVYNTDPNLELIVYGRNKIMHSKYCPLKRLGMCSNCKEGRYGLKDDYATFPLQFNNDCTATLLNSKALNIIDDIDNLNGISAYRLVFTTETKEEIEKIIKICQSKLKDHIKTSTFDVTKHTRGHYTNNPL